MSRSKVTSFFIHAAGWLVFLGFPLLFMNRTQESSSASFAIILSPYYWLFCLTYMFMFYLNAWYLVPQMVFHKKYVMYTVIVLLLSVLVYYIRPFDNLLGHNLRKGLPGMTSPGMPGAGLNTSDTLAPNSQALPFGPLPHQDMRMQDPRFKQPAKPPMANVDMVGLFIFIMIMGLSMGVTTVQKWQLTEQRIAKAEADKAQAELSFLKAQINPHFLFNTLNNIYALSVTDSEHTSESIMKLSNIMRYVTDDVSDNLVSLRSEWDCINDYIDLQKLRLGKKTKLNFELEGQIQHQQIAPLVLMTFIENVFKYGISKHEATEITIRLTVDGNRLRFFCQNTIVENGSKAKRTGIGVNNTRQRLNHLYPGKHQLNVSTNNNQFTVNLEIES